jgi:hypothetical protein
MRRRPKTHRPEQDESLFDYVIAADIVARPVFGSDLLRLRVMADDDSGRLYARPT